MAKRISVTLGTSETMRRGGAASAISRPVGSVTVSAAAPDGRGAERPDEERRPPQQADPTPGRHRESAGATTARTTPADLKVAISGDPRRSPCEVDEQGGARALAEPQREVEVRHQAEVGERRACPGSAERCEAKSAWRAAGASATATRAAASEMKPSSTTGTRRAAPARTTPTRPAISNPPTLASTSRASAGSGRFDRERRRDDLDLARQPASSTPVPGPVTASAARR